MSHGEMPPRDGAEDAATELAQFTSFLKRMWGALAGLSTLFPLSNAVAQVVPLQRYPDGAMVYVAPGVVTILSTLVCLFLVLSLFAQRRRFQEKPRLGMLKQAWWSFVPGLVCLGIYLGGYYAVTADFYFLGLGWESSDLRRIGGDAVLVVAYVGFFALTTRAFVLLGLMEYLHGRRG